MKKLASLFPTQHPWILQHVFMCTVFCAIFTFVNSARNECKPREFPGSSSFTCVCSATYCDTVDSYEPLSSGTFAVYTSSQHGDRLAKRTYKISKKSNASDTTVRYTVNSTAQYQKMTGFGGAFTDSAGYNILNLSKPAQDNLLKSYFHPSGIEYTFGRVPVASCDFSLRIYSYDDYAKDFSMQKFKLVEEDFQYKIPIIKRAQAMSKRKINLIASPWSAPAWMKDNNKMTGGGQLIGPTTGKYYEAYALYLLKFLDSYASQNLTFWGLTMLNEPSAGLFFNYSFQSMLFSPENERDFVKFHLGPMAQNSSYKDVKIIMLDDQRLFLPFWAQKILGDPDAAKYISGIGVHWYRDTISPIEKLDETHEQFPDQFLLYTESSNGYEAWSVPVMLGDWPRGESYSEDILWDVNHWVTGWVDWNLALDEDGGPNWAKNFVDSGIIVNAKDDEFYKQPMFYHIGHFSKFIVPDSIRIDFIAKEMAFQLAPSAAFLLPDGRKAAVILNKQTVPMDITIKDSDSGYLNAQVPAKSIQTYIWN
ncbi:lysosomal acid glucosylceramidase-like [Apostichopus japonicus]|uniref:lysosomal acid glucosylceramidase-like n=1 Tax=Stichopus japonicus TaxID=307972 RepID=UPI003AB75CE5